MNCHVIMNAYMAADVDDDMDDDVKMTSPARPIY
jgi:hypothetical protein